MSGCETGNWLPCDATPPSCGEAHDVCFPEEVTHSAYFRYTDNWIDLVHSDTSTAPVQTMLVLSPMGNAGLALSECTSGT